MKKTIEFLMLSFLILILSFGVYGFTFKFQNESPMITPTPSITNLEIPTEIDSAELFDYFYKINERILNTVYWTLGTFITLTLGIVGFNWYSGKKQFESEKEEIANSLQKMKTELIKDIKDKLSEEIINTKSQIDNRIEKEISEKFQDLDDRTKSLNIDLLEIEAEKWKNQKVYKNELKVYINLIENLKPRHWKIPMILNKINEILKLYKMNKELSSDVNQISELISRVEELSVEYKDLKDIVVAKSRTLLD